MEDSSAKNAEKIIEQLTLRKLSFSQQLLSEAKLAKTGIRTMVRGRLQDAVANGAISVETTKALLDELDCWGDQRIILRKMPDSLRDEFGTIEQFRAKAEQVEMGHLFEGEIILEPPLELTPMRITYEERADGRYVKLMAAKTREVWFQQPDIPEIHDEVNHPGVVFKPYKKELQKVVAFAEIGIDSRLMLLSTKKLHYGKGYTDEFEEFYQTFQSLISFNGMESISLYGAARALHAMSQDELSIYVHNRRTSSGGIIGTRSHSRKVDVRQDSEINQALSPLAASVSPFCNCIWKPCGDLKESVHTHVYAPEGQVSILGQVKEASARYVLRRILNINN